MTNQVFIAHEAFQKLFAYAEASKKLFDSEVGGYLLVKELEEGGLLIEDVLLPPQEVSGGSVDVVKGGSKVVKFEDLPKVKGWWHSHHNMSTFHSSTDDDTLTEKWDGETLGSSNYGLSLVVAFPPRKMLCYMQYYKPIKLKKLEIEVDVLTPESQELYSKCVKDVQEQVKKKQWGYTNYRDEPEWEFRGGCWIKKANAEKNSKTPTTRESLTTCDEEDFEGLVFSDDTDEDLEESVMDYTTRFSIAEMKQSGIWNPEQFPEVQKLFEKAKAYREQLKKDEKKYKTKCKSSLVKKDERTCPHQSYNDKGRIICFFQGRNFDCTQCTHRVPEKKPSPPSHLEKPKEEQSSIVPISSSKSTETK